MLVLCYGDYLIYDDLINNWVNVFSNWMLDEILLKLFMFIE